jgi:hypothetical protein
MEAAKGRHGAEVDRALRTPSQDVTAGLAEAQAEFLGEYSDLYYFDSFLQKLVTGQLHRHEAVSAPN